MISRAVSPVRRKLPPTVQANSLPAVSEYHLAQLVTTSSFSVILSGFAFFARITEAKLRL